MRPWESVVRLAGRGMVVPLSAARIGAGSGFVRCKIDAPHLHATFPQDKVRSAASGVKVGVRADLGFVRRACPRAFGRSFSLSRRACRRRRIGSESLTISSAYVQRVHATLGVRGSPGRVGNGLAGIGCSDGGQVRSVARPRAAMQGIAGSRVRSARSGIYARACAFCADLALPSDVFGPRDFAPSLRLASAPYRGGLANGSHAVLGSKRPLCDR
jgi:hypothetical protein